MVRGIRISREDIKQFRRGNKPISFGRKAAGLGIHQQKNKSYDQKTSKNPGQISVHAEPVPIEDPDAVERLFRPVFDNYLFPEMEKGDVGLGTATRVLLEAIRPRVSQDFYVEYVQKYGMASDSCKAQKGYRPESGSSLDKLGNDVKLHSGDTEKIESDSLYKFVNSLVKKDRR